MVYDVSKIKWDNTKRERGAFKGHQCVCVCVCVTCCFPIPEGQPGNLGLEEFKSDH